VPTAVITGSTRGLGRALATALVARGWHVVVTARTRYDVEETAAALGEPVVAALAGDVADPAHRRAVAAAVDGRLDLLVHNASTLGPTPLRTLADLDAADVARVLEVNVLGAHALTRTLLPALVRAGGAVVAVSSDAAVEHYETWGAYGASKAALDHLTLTWAREEPGVTWWAVDPGDMRTAMHRAAFPTEDISDRPLPEEVAVPAVLALLEARPPSGRYRAADIVRTEGAA
jgi:NAD(P)-dependent dehydrogenase (short-subunit alcohol dehydrogenase family)